MRRALEDRASSVGARLENGGVDLPQLTVEPMPDLIDDVARKSISCLFDQGCRPTECLDDPCPVGKCHYGCIDMVLRFPQLHSDCFGQGVDGGKIGKVCREMIPDIALCDG